MKYFYSNYIVIEELLEEIKGLNLSLKEKAHLASLIDSSIHHSILDEVLSNLKNGDKKLFLKLMHEDPENEKILNFLTEKIENIEERIKKVSQDLVAKLHKEVKEAKKI